jgi:hypothetical protein
MNKGKLFKTLTVLMIATLGLVGCEQDPEEYCEEYPICDLSPTVCCDDTGACTYKYSGTTYNNLEDLMAAICPQSMAIPDIKALQTELDELTKKLIEEARVAAICN